MKKLLCAFSFLSLVAIAAPSFAHAEHAMNEIDGNANATLSFGSGSNTTFSLGVGYDRVLMPDFLQGTALATFSTSSPSTTFNVTVGPTLNYSMDNSGLANAFFLTLTGGLAYTSAGGTSSSAFAYNTQIGKRTSIFPSVSWKPFFAMLGVTTTGSSPQFQVVPVSFSFEF